MMRVDTAVRLEIQRLTRAQVHEACDAGWVRSKRGRRLAKGDKVEAGDLDLGALRERIGRLREGSDFAIPVLETHDDFVVLDKPAGVPGHPLHLYDEGTITHWMFRHFPETRIEFPEVQPTVTPHRLDTDTSGILIAARTREAYETWRTRFGSTRVTKTYLAWTWGTPKRDSLVLDLPIAHDAADESRMVVVRPGVHYRGRALDAFTKARVRKTSGDATLWEVECTSGVTHQVRVHLSDAGLPLVGDAKYDPAYGKRSRNLAQHLLRAVRLAAGEFTFTADPTAFEGLL